MEIYDIIMLVIIGGAALFGAIKGFAWQLASIVSIVASYIVAFRFREPFSQSIQAEPPWNRFLAMLILFIGTSLVIWVLFRMISRTIDRLKLHEFDRQIGFIFGGIKGFLYCSLITLFAVTLMGNTVREKIVASKSGRFIAEVLNRSDSVIPEEIHVVIEPYLDRFDERFASTQDSLDSYSQQPQSGAHETGFGGQSWWPNRASNQPSESQPAPSGSMWDFGSGQAQQQAAQSQPTRSWGAPAQGYQQPPAQQYQRAQAAQQQPYYNGF